MSPPPATLLFSALLLTYYPTTTQEVQPVASLDVARFCSSSSNQLPPHPGLPLNTCRHHTLADAHAASAALLRNRQQQQQQPQHYQYLQHDHHHHQQQQHPMTDSLGGRCDQESTCSRLWECRRWDGEVTLQELRGQRPAPLFYLSVVFLVSVCASRFGYAGVGGGQRRGRACCLDTPVCALESCPHVLLSAV